MLKTTYQRFPPKLLTYRSYEQFWNDSLKNRFESETYAIQSGDIRSLKTAIIKSFNAVASFKKRIARGNNKLHLTSLVRKEIMTSSRLKNKAKKSGKEEDLKAYKQRNLVLKLNRKAKKKFLKSFISTGDKMKNKNFRKLCKPFFTDKGSQYNQNITLIEKKRSISEKHKVANIFNKYFQETQQTRMETTKRTYLPKSRYYFRYIFSSP